MQQLKAENQQVKRENQQKQQLLQEKDQNIQYLQLNNNHLTTQNGQLQESRQSLQQNNDQLTTQNQELRSQNQYLQQQVDQRDRQLQEVTAEKQQAHQQIQELRRQNRSQNQTQTWVINRREINLSDKELGRGAYGWVKEATFRGCKVAVKCLHHELISDYNLHVFDREMTMAARCRHPNLLQFIGATSEGVPLIVTEIMHATIALGKS